MAQLDQETITVEVVSRDGRAYLRRIITHVQVESWRQIPEDDPFAREASSLGEGEVFSWTKPGKSYGPNVPSTVIPSDSDRLSRIANMPSEQATPYKTAGQSSA